MIRVSSETKHEVLFNCRARSKSVSFVFFARNARTRAGMPPKQQQQKANTARHITSFQGGLNFRFSSNLFCFFPWFHALWIGLSLCLLESNCAQPYSGCLVGYSFIVGLGITLAISTILCFACLPFSQSVQAELNFLRLTYTWGQLNTNILICICIMIIHRQCICGDHNMIL